MLFFGKKTGETVHIYLRYDIFKSAFLLLQSVETFTLMRTINIRQVLNASEVPFLLSVSILTYKYCCGESSFPST